MRRLTLVKRGLEGSRFDLSRARSSRLRMRLCLGREHPRQLIEKPLHVRRQRRRELVERGFDVGLERRARERLGQRPAEVKCAQFRKRKACAQAFERLAVQHPPRLPVVARLVVVDGESGFFERLKIAADGARGDVALRGEVVDRDAGGACLLDLAKDRPLPDDFGVSRHA